MLSSKNGHRKGVVVKVITIDVETKISALVRSAIVEVRVDEYSHDASVRQEDRPISSALTCDRNRVGCMLSG